MKRIAAFFLLICFTLTLVSCRGYKPDLLGDWALLYGNAGRFGYMLRFEKSGSMYCTPGIESSVLLDNLDNAFQNMNRYLVMEYNIKNDKVIEITVSVLEEKLMLEVEYSLNKDVLVLDKVPYHRV